MTASSPASQADIAKPAEKRKASRQRTLLRAKLIYADGATFHDGLVTQISATGAKISLVGEPALPERFRVQIALRQIDAQARVVRRDADGVAVAFESDDEASSRAVASLRERVRMLEAENRMLRANCATLAAQLERTTASY